jgi:hypothetical protein
VQNRDPLADRWPIYKDRRRRHNYAVTYVGEVQVGYCYDNYGCNDEAVLTRLPCNVCVKGNVAVKAMLHSSVEAHTCRTKGVAGLLLSYITRYTGKRSSFHNQDRWWPLGLGPSHVTGLCPYARARRRYLPPPRQRSSGWDDRGRGSRLTNEAV